MARLEAELLAAVRDETVAARIMASGSIPRPLAGAEFGGFIAEETRRLGELVRASGIRAE
jgi:tripartite-type tricarboxylate transporter receptor subunit TctC